MTRKQPDLAGVLGQASADKRIDILRRIGTDGSISQAARGAGVSYKAAWQALETLGNLAGTPLVAKAVGGSGGGGAVLTPAGEQVLRAADRLARSRAQVLAGLHRSAAGSGAAAGLAASGLRTSMRNQLPCRVRALSPTQGLVRVTLELPGGAILRSRITRESVQLLGLAKAMPVLALFKATAVQVGLHIDAADARNLLHGSVIRASRAAQGGEVALRLDASQSIVGFAPGSTALRPGMAAMASIDESGVVIAIAT